MPRRSFSIGTTQVTFIATDISGNQSQATANVSVTPLVTSDPVVEVSPTGPDGTPDPEDLPAGPQPTSWSRQRSSLREITITLPVPVASISAADVVLTNLGVDPDQDPDVVVPLRDDQLTLSSDGLTLSITLDADQLGDGVYQLELLPAVTGGESFIIAGDADNGLYVLTADWNGSGGVNIQDFATFAYWFGQTVPTAPEYLDLNGSGGINIQDFAAFAANFGQEIPLPPNSGDGEQFGTLASPLDDPFDVDGDGIVKAVDALRIINRIEKQTAEMDSSYDLNQDGLLTTDDARIVLKQIDLPVLTPQAGGITTRTGMGDVNADEIYENVTLLDEVLSLDESL